MNTISMNETIHLPHANKKDESNERQKLLKYLLPKQKVIVFSPHLDDAALSIGSLIAFLAHHNKDITVINVFTEGSDVISEFTSKLISQGGYTTATEYFEARRLEDRVALKTLGVDTVLNLGFTDAAWRKKGKDTSVYEKTVIGVNRNEIDELLLQNIISELKNKITVDTNTAVFTPLGWGKHVDHILLRDACTEAFNEVIYYADYPYLQKYKLDDVFIENKHLRSLIWTEDHYSTKAKSILCYKTQNISLFLGEPMTLEYETIYLPEKLLL